MLTLTVSAFLPLLMGSSYNRGIHRTTAYLGLYLAALGDGGIRPCVSALADQFDVADPVERVKKGSFFNWFYFSINIGSLLSATVIVWVQDNIGWGVGFAIPAVLMLSGLPCSSPVGRFTGAREWEGVLSRGSPRWLLQL